MQPNQQTTRDRDQPIIRIRGLSNRFGEQVVHEGLDLDVKRGEIIGVVGGSGSGKSVLMRSILGLRKPDEGEIEVLGIDARSQEPADRNHIERRTGVLFQDGALFSSLTVGENVQVPLKEHYPDLSDSLRYELALLKTKLSGLPAEALDKLPSQLSGGMRKRAGLARALALDPPLLFLDEPTAGLDPIGAAAFDELTLTLQRALGLTVFLITHDLDTLYAVCDRVAVLADNKVVINAPIGEVEKFDHPWVQEYFHGPRARAAQKTSQKSPDKSPEKNSSEKGGDDSWKKSSENSETSSETTPEGSSKNRSESNSDENPDKTKNMRTPQPDPRPEGN